MAGQKQWNRQQFQMTAHDNCARHSEDRAPGLRVADPKEVGEHRIGQDSAGKGSAEHRHFARQTKPDLYINENPIRSEQLARSFA
jgi:hypothetical protein